MTFREVEDFIVIPPAEIAAAVFRSRERLEAHLAGCFPRYRFHLHDNLPMMEDDRFSIYPIMGRAGGEDCPPESTYLCDPPRPGLITEIRRACEAFEIKPRRLS